jgi:hypothetical protein
MPQRVQAEFAQHGIAVQFQPVTTGARQRMDVDA